MITTTRSPGDTADDRTRATGGEIVRLNVGGQTVFTTRSTLTKDAGSALGRMFAEDVRIAPSALLDDGSYFIDCDPHCFAIILDHMRHGTVDVDAGLVGRVRCAADSLGVTSLVEACDAQLAARAPPVIDSVKRRPCESCPRCGEILADKDEREHLAAQMDYFLRCERNAIAGSSWHRTQYGRCRSRLYHECRSPLRFARDHWFEIGALVVGVYAVQRLASFFYSIQW
nr:BTB/POZ domain containing protein [Pandoravirus belohorizontensis]